MEPLILLHLTRKRKLDKVNLTPLDAFSKYCFMIIPLYIIQNISVYDCFSISVASHAELCSCVNITAFLSDNKGPGPCYLAQFSISSEACLIPCFFRAEEIVPV